MPVKWHRVSRKLSKVVLQTRVGRTCFRVLRRDKPAFECPICGYRGPFADAWLPYSRLRHLLCPGCRSATRHRLLFLALQQLAQTRDFRRDSLLYLAPEPCLHPMLKRTFGSIMTADRDRTDVDVRMDLTRVPLPDASMDCVIAAHVLEHIQDDHAALAHIRRILRPGGLALLPVPVVVARTVEYPQPSPREEWHVRAPGLDYYDRYRPFFRSVTILDSAQFPDRHQLYVYENRAHWPTRHAPWRTPMPGERHPDYVPVCAV